MASVLKVDKLDPQSGTALEIGTSGDTITIPSGVTIANSGTATGFGAVLTGSTNNTVTTVTAANAIQGETNLTYDGTILGCGATGSAADLGVGVHIRTADSGASVDSSGDELVIEGSGSAGISILTGTGSDGGIYFGDSGDDNIAYIIYEHDVNRMAFAVNAAERMLLHNDGRVSINSTSDGGSQVYMVSGADNPVLKLENSLTSGVSADVPVLYVRTNQTSGTHDIMQGLRSSDVKFIVENDGDTYNQNGTFSSISDERLKENITDANSQWDDIKALKVKNFDLKIDDTAPRQIGVIAQELEASGMNGLVKERNPTVPQIEIDGSLGTLEDDTDRPILDEEGNETGTYHKKVKSVNSKVKLVKNSILFMKAVKALQESMERIEQLEAKVTALESA